MNNAIPSLAALAATLLLVACGGAETNQSAESSSGPTSPEETAGGEVEAEPAPAEEAPRPVVVRTTIPVPVPQTAVPRDDLSSELQAVWTAVEEQVSTARPEGPEETTVPAVQAWAEGPFTAWIGARRELVDATRAMVGEVASEPAYERAVALALWAYAMEDFGAQIAGAPVPDEIARDEELRGIYIGSLNQASLPLGQAAIELYADCQQRLVALGDDSPWLPWRAYCVQRGVEVIEGYGLTPPERAAEDSGAEPAADATPVPPG